MEGTRITQPSRSSSVRPPGCLCWVSRRLFFYLPLFFFILYFGTSTDSIYEFGKNLGIAFQVQDDYLDAFGDPEKFGKQPGGDIIVNKKTFLMIHAMDVATDGQKKLLADLMKDVPVEDVDKEDKVNKVLQVFRDCKVDVWAAALKEKYYKEAMKHLEEIAVLTTRKKELEVLAQYLLQRDK